jgi:hypothetical protein
MPAAITGSRHGWCGSKACLILEESTVAGDAHRYIQFTTEVLEDTRLLSSLTQFNDRVGERRNSGADEDHREQ